MSNEIENIVLLPENTVAVQLSDGTLVNSYDLCEISKWFPILDNVVCLWRAKKPAKVLTMMNTPIILNHKP